MPAFSYTGKEGARVAGPIYLHVDISKLKSTIEKMRAVHTQHEFELLMMRAFRRTGQRVKTILKTELPKDYHAKPTWIGQNVKSPQTSFGGFGGMAVSCSIPIDGARGVLGRQFSASGPRGRRSKKPKAYKITARIVKAGATTLPSHMRNQGGQPPFIARGGTGGGIVFTRKGKSRLPIVRVVGIGVPQMPMNRSKEDVQDEIMETVKSRIEHEHAYLIARCR